MTDLNSFGAVTDGLIFSAVVLDWYDGPLRGVARAGDGSAFYFYAVAWDADYDSRLFALRPINGNLLEEFECALARASTPQRGEDWMPTPIDDKSQEAVHAKVVEARLLEAAQPVAYLILGKDVRGKVRILERAAGPETLFVAADRSNQVEDLAKFLGTGG